MMFNDVQHQHTSSRLLICTVLIFIQSVVLLIQNSYHFIYGWVEHTFTFTSTCMFYTLMVKGPVLTMCRSSVTPSSASLFFLPRHPCEHLELAVLRSHTSSWQWIYTLRKYVNKIKIRFLYFDKDHLDRNLRPLTKFVEKKKKKKKKRKKKKKKKKKKKNHDFHDISYQLKIIYIRSNTNCLSFM